MDWERPQCFSARNRYLLSSSFSASFWLSLRNRTYSLPSYTHTHSIPSLPTLSLFFLCVFAASWVIMYVFNHLFEGLSAVLKKCCSSASSWWHMVYVDTHTSFSPFSICGLMHIAQNDYTGWNYQFQHDWLTSAQESGCTGFNHYDNRMP